MAASIKITFGLLLAALYILVAVTMLNGAFRTPGYVPNAATDWIVAITGGGLIAFVAAQIGVVIASDGGNPQERLASRLYGANPTQDQNKLASRTLIVLAVDVFVLVALGAVFVFLYVQPERIAVAEGADELTEAPEYISLQAQAIIGLIVAGAGGVGVAAAR